MGFAAINGRKVSVSVSAYGEAEGRATKNMRRRQRRKERAGKDGGGKKGKSEEDGR